MLRDVIVSEKKSKMSEFYNKYSAKNFANANIFNSTAPKTTTMTTTTTEKPMPAAGSATAKPGQQQEQKQQQQQPKTEKLNERSSNLNNNENININNANNKAREAAEHDNDDYAQADCLFKHPLQNTWTLWYLEQDHSKSWEDMQNEITSFDTVEDFWSLYNHIKPPSEIKPGSDYSLFKKGIRPMWEDAANKQGGRWIININKSSKPELDNLWLDVLLCLIGEAFDHSEEICGAVVNVRPRIHKISIWTADANNEEAAVEIGRKLRESLHLGRQNLQYQMHKDTMVKQGSTIKSIYNL